MGVKTAKVNQRKQEAVIKMKELFTSFRDIIFTDFSGLNVAQITELRKKLKELENDYRVVKNNYTRIAMSELDMPEATEYLTGPTAVALVRQNVGPAAKAILSFTKDTTVKVKGAIVGGKALSSQQVESLSKLPGREQLIAQLMSVMNAPLQNFLYILNAVPQKLVRTIKAIADKKGENDN